MDSISVNRFQENLKTFVEQAIETHTPLKVTRRSGADFIVMSAEDWERERETLYVLQNSSLMQQIATSMASQGEREGYIPSAEEMHEISGV